MKTNDVDRMIVQMTENRARQRSEALIIAMVGKDNSDLWWNSPNKEFGLITPNEMWAEDYQLVYNYLMHHGFVGGGS